MLQKIISIKKDFYRRAFLLFFALYNMAIAQLPDYHLKVIRNDGLNNPIPIEQILRDSRGFLWLLSPTKIQRFDGKIVRSFSFSQKCMNMQEDDEGRIWLACENNIFNFQIDHTGFTIVEGCPTSSSYLRILKGNDKKIYLLTSAGLYERNKGAPAFIKLNISFKRTSASFPFLESWGNWIFYKPNNETIARYNIISGEIDSLKVENAIGLVLLNQDSVWVRQGIGESVLGSFKTKRVTPILPAQFNEKINPGGLIITKGFADIAKHLYFALILDKGFYKYDPSANKFS